MMMSTVNRSETFIGPISAVSMQISVNKKIILLLTPFISFDPSCFCRKEHHHALSLELFIDSSELGTPGSAELSLGSAAEASSV